MRSCRASAIPGLEDGLSLAARYEPRNWRRRRRALRRKRSRDSSGAATERRVLGWRTTTRDSGSERHGIDQYFYCGGTPSGTAPAADGQARPTQDSPMGRALSRFSVGRSRCRAGADFRNEAFAPEGKARTRADGGACDRAASARRRVQGCGQGQLPRSSSEDHAARGGGRRAGVPHAQPRGAAPRPVGGDARNGDGRPAGCCCGSGDHR